MKDKSIIKWLYGIIGKNRINIVILIALQVITGAMGVYYAILLRDVIDNAVEKNKSQFFFYLALVIFIVLLQIILNARIRYFEEKSRSSIENILKGNLFSTILKKDFESVNTTHSGEWLNRLTSDTVVVANGIVEILPGLSGMVIKLIGALVMILTIEPKFSYLIIPACLCIIGITYPFRKVLKRLHRNIQEKDGKLRVFLQEHIENLMVVCSFATENQTASEAYDRMDEHKKARMKKIRLSNICSIAFSAAMHGIYLLGMGYCGYGIINNTVSYGTLMTILQLINQIQAPFANISGFLPKYYAVIASAERIIEASRFDDRFIEESKSCDEVYSFYNNKFKKFIFENAGFTYQPIGKSQDKSKMPVVLKNVNLEINKGDYVAFTGQSGCGKSTMLKLLMCLYHLDEGEYLLSDNEGNEMKMSSKWSRFFSYVPQGNQLMSGTIREVITFSDKTKMKETEKIKTALKISCADEFVDELENGLDTVLGERGQGVSEGQMQRIAIARAIFSDAPILLLDEATSSLDSETERRVIENLKNMTNKTVITVTHRPASLEICNKIVNFEEKQITVECIE